jgi:hypothetical protein
VARSRSTRALRGLIAATVATFVALMSHVAAGGAMPGWLGVAVPWALAAMVCTVLAGRALSLWRLSIAVVLSQALFHTLFVLGTVTPGAAISGHVHGAAAAAQIGPTTAAASAPDLAMWASHLAAAVLTIVVLHRGEAAVRRLLALASEVVDALRLRLDVVDGIRVPALRPARAIADAPRRSPSLGWYRSTTARRGPPLLLSV